SPMETAIVMESFGGGLVVEPYLPSAVLGASLVEAGGTSTHKERLLPELASGNIKLALAVYEPGARYSVIPDATIAEACTGGYSISGRKSVVLGGGYADYLIVPARTDGGPGEEAGITLFLIP